MNQLIRCTTCNEAFLKTPWDQHPEYETISGRRVERDDLNEFLKIHREHQLQELRVIADSFVSEKAYLEPVKISYFKATADRETFMIRRFRERIDEPLRYQVIPGGYSLKCARVEIQARAIAAQLKEELREGAPSDAELTALLKLFRGAAETVDIKRLKRIPEESYHPLEVYYRPDNLILRRFLRACRTLFRDQRGPAFRNFIRRHKDDVLLLKATYRIELREKSKSDRKSSAYRYLVSSSSSSSVNSTSLRA
jgi:hypothetical protein